MTDGLCPFADQIAHRELLEGWQQGFVDRVGFCDHTAGGFYNTMTRYTFWNDPNGDGNHADRVSVHFAVAGDGRILQVLNIFDTSWGQGRLGPVVTWPPYNAMGRKNPNGYLISTEHEDVETINGQTHYVPGSQWTEAQYAADLRVKRWCVEEVKRVLGKDLLTFGIDSLAGHHMFDGVNRPECPGRFWRNEYRQRLFNDLTSSSEEEEMIRHNAIASWFDDRALSADGNFLVMQAQDDFGLPNEAREVLFAVYMDNGEVKWFDGLSQREAGSAGNRGVNYVQIRAIMADPRPNIDRGKTLIFRAESDAEIGRVFCLGYFR